MNNYSNFADSDFEEIMNGCAKTIQDCRQELSDVRTQYEEQFDIQYKHQPWELDIDNPGRELLCSLFEAIQNLDYAVWELAEQGFDAREEEEV